MAAHTRDGAAEMPSQMPQWRKCQVSFLLIVFVGITAHQVTQKRDDFPFSRFHMYSGRQGKSYTRTMVLGVGPAGEFSFQAKMTKPIYGATLRWALAALTKKPERRTRALEILKSLYDTRKELGLHDGPELMAVRLVERTWSPIKVDLSNRSRPRETVRASLSFLDQRTRAALQAESSGVATALDALLVDGDVVIQAASMTLAGHARYVKDRYARDGKALVVRGTHPRAPAREPHSVAEMEFLAPPGQYRIWLRGKVLAAKMGGSVWLQFDHAAGASAHARADTPHGLGNLGQLYPERAFAWSSAAPGARPAIVKLRGQKHRLRISPREGEVAIDQIWLSRKQTEIPPWTAPVRLRGEEQP
jgi:hypothetical protein